MATRRKLAGDDAKPLVDAIDDALSAVLELVRSLKQRAKESGRDAGRTGEKIRRVAGEARRTAGTRLEKAWDVLIHGNGETERAAPSRKARRR